MQDLQPGVRPVGEHEQRTSSRIFAQSFPHQSFQAIEALAQIARLHGHEDFQAASKAQHHRTPTPKSIRSSSAAKRNCVGDSTWIRAPPGNSIFKPCSDAFSPPA
jgi:hypothetical protein